MIIQPHISPKRIDEFEVILGNGIMMPITIDGDAGDTFDTDSSPLLVRFNISAKPSFNNPEIMLPSEEITIFVGQIASISHRIREVMPPTPDQQAKLKTLHQIHPTVQ